MLDAGGLRHNLLCHNGLRNSHTFPMFSAGRGVFRFRVLRPANQTEGRSRLQPTVGSRSDWLLASLRVTPGTDCNWISFLWQPLHLNLWYREKDRVVVEALIRDLQENYGKWAG